MPFLKGTIRRHSKVNAAFFLIRQFGSRNASSKLATSVEKRKRLQFLKYATWTAVEHE